MSTCTRTYLSTVTKKPCTHEYSTSITEYFFRFQSDREKQLFVSRALPHLFQMPLICLFSDLKKVASSILFQMPKSKYCIFMLKMDKKGAPLCFVKIKKWHHLFFGKQKI